MSTAIFTRAVPSIGFGAIRNLARGVAAFLYELDIAIARSHEVQRLLALPEETLARRGLQRDEIAPHVMATIPG